MPPRPLVIVSNRGPVSFASGPDGTLEAKRGAGGLVSALAPVVADTDALWIAAAITDGDRQAASRGTIDAEGFRVRTLALDPDTYRAAYDDVCNATLWFVHHGLFDLVRQPSFGPWWDEAWEAYRQVNHAFADVVAEEAPEDAAVLVQDYHLALVAPELRRRRDDLRLVHFSHTPFADPDLFRVLPEAAGREVLEGMAAHHACGFHTQRWARSFARCCDEIAGLRPTTFVGPVAPDAADVQGVAAGEASTAAYAALDRELGDRAFLVRVDRIELSKNIGRGFAAFDLLLERHPELRGRVVFGAFCYPSRQGVPAYRAYAQEVAAAAAEVNERWGDEHWTPVVWEGSDDFPRSVAALARADVLLVNPIRDGLNLVAKEGPIVNRRDLLVVLSTEAGVHEELAGAVFSVNPFDVRETAEALHTALTADPATRAAQAAELRRRAIQRTPADWLADQLAAAG